MKQQKKTASPGKALKKKPVLSKLDILTDCLKNDIRDLHLKTTKHVEENLFHVYAIEGMAIYPHLRASANLEGKNQEIELPISEITSIRKENAKRYLFKKS